ncbi:MAG: UDP-N-acetylmuramoyl-L-alanine--D-glutamate ligase [Desulfovibrio sp.]|nr:UDP-N-acetylmuramoyl-L-alanine--D-glutamate ligase [Desulfovibrio sp.]
MRRPVTPGELAVIVGAGASGLAAARLLSAVGARLRLLDANAANVTEETRVLADDLGMEIIRGPHRAEDFSGAALVVTSPGVPVSLLLPLVRKAGAAELIGEMELALRYVSEPILAVTGTSGKTTTVSLAAAMLEEAGRRVFLGGNIGTPLSEHVLRNERADVLALELSSFQLQGLSHLRPRVAVLLNLTVNHLDHHKDMAEYTDAKFRLFALQEAGDVAILPANDPALRSLYEQRRCRARLEFFTATDRFAKTRLIGTHNRANAEAAFLACLPFGVNEEAAARAVAAFVPLPHRLETVGELNGVLYVNDSKSTTVEALRAALSSFDSPVLLLAGGKFKGGDLASLRGLVKEKVRAVALFGAGRNFFEEAWQGAAPISWDAALPEAVARLRPQARPGDVVLLSPATSSYDSYRNYLERGDHFRSLVGDALKELEKRAGQEEIKGETA